MYALKYINNRNTVAKRFIHANINSDKHRGIYIIIKKPCKEIHHKK